MTVTATRPTLDTARRQFLAAAEAVNAKRVVTATIDGVPGWHITAVDRNWEVQVYASGRSRTVYWQDLTGIVID